MKALPYIYYCLQGKGAHKQWYRDQKKKEENKVLPIVEDQTLTVRPQRTANLALVNAS